MYEPLIYLLTGVVLIAFLYLFWKVVKKLAVNSAVGLFALFVLKYAFMLDIPLNIWTVAVTAFFGLAGVGSILLLVLGGMI